MKRKIDPVVVILYTICTIAVIGILLMLHEADVVGADDRGRYNYPTAGITLYMGALQKYSLELSEPQEITLEEPKVVSVELSDKGPKEYLRNYFGYVPEEWELQEFYQIVMDECGYEPEDGIGAVSDVIANRCRSDQFPNTIHEVIYQKNQFEPIVAGTFGRFEVTDLVYEICDDHIAEGPMDTEILFFTAGNYNPYCEPMYIIGNHYFGK